MLVESVSVQPLPRVSKLIHNKEKRAKKECEMNKEHNS